MKASEVASQLRTLADALDKAQDAEINHSYLSLDAGSDKESFLALAHVWPRPFAKKVDFADTTYSELGIEHKIHGGTIRLKIDQSSVCRLVKPAQPAVYDCAPLLSQEDEATLAL
jgi:hypothetical protein